MYIICVLHNRKSFNPQAIHENLIEKNFSVSAYLLISLLLLLIRLLLLLRWLLYELLGGGLSELM